MVLPSCIMPTMILTLCLQDAQPTTRVNKFRCLGNERMKAIATNSLELCLGGALLAREAQGLLEGPLGSAGTEDGRGRDPRVSTARSALEGFRSGLLKDLGVRQAPCCPCCCCCNRGRCVGKRL